MEQNRTLSDEAVSAFIDDQLTGDEKMRFYQTLENDGALMQYTCRLRTLREMVREAYAPSTLPAPPRTQRRRPGRAGRYGVAVAVLMFVAGALSGWLVHAGLPPATTAADRAAGGNVPVAQGRDVLLHISDDRPQHMRAALTDAETLLARAQARGIRLRLEILANGSGLDLLRADRSPYRREIAQLARRYHNVSFLACAKTLEHLKERSVHYRLLPQARIVPSAFDEIVRRMESGWVYVRV